MAEPKGTSKRAQLRERATQQELASRQDEEGEAPRRGTPHGNLAARAAALIAGGADPGPQEDPAEGGGEGAADTHGDDTPDHSADTNDAPESDTDEGDDAEKPDDDPNQLPLTLDDAQKKLGMTRAEFNKLEVTLVGGTTMTLGQLKDSYQDVLKLDKSREEFDDERGRWELERVGTYRSINAIIDAIPKNAQTAGLLRQLERQHEDNRQRELETLHFARPGWKDPNYATAAKAKIVAMCKDYGISRGEVEGLLDHRHLLLAQDYAELREKVRESRAQAKKLNEPGGNRPTGQGAPARRDAHEANPRSLNGSGRREKPTQESVARRAGAILRKR